MLSKTYGQVLKASQKQQVLRALFAPVMTTQQAQRQFSHSTLVKNAQMNASRTILSKQLHYLHSNKVSAALKPSDDFMPRHLGNDNKNTQEILKKLGLSSIDQLMDETVPESIRLPKD